MSISGIRQSQHVSIPAWYQTNQWSETYIVWMLLHHVLVGHQWTAVGVRYSCHQWSGWCVVVRVCQHSVRQRAATRHVWIIAMCHVHAVRYHVLAGITICHGISRICTITGYFHVGGISHAKASYTHATTGWLDTVFNNDTLLHWQEWQRQETAIQYSLNKQHAQNQLKSDKTKPRPVDSLQMTKFICQMWNTTVVKVIRCWTRTNAQSLTVVINLWVLQEVKAAL